MIENFKTKEEFKKFCDTSMFCICGKLMTGFHMSGCARLRKIEKRFVLCVCGHNMATHDLSGCNSLSCSCQNFKVEQSKAND